VNKIKKRILKPGEKELLIKDLLPRIPTGLFVDVPDEEEPKELEKVVRWKIIYGRARSLEDCLDGLIPYLRPLSSMTVEEREEVEVLIFGEWFAQDSGKVDGEGWIEILANYVVSGIDPGFCSDYVDWLVSHHFDFRGLIPAGLALEAKEGMYDN
jgi:hypothetical protein